MKILFTVNGGPQSAMGTRARGLASHLPATFQPEFIYRPDGPKLAAARMFAAHMEAAKPDLVYVLDLAVSGVAAALGCKMLQGFPVIIDTGDAITALARSAKLRGRAGIAATWLLEEAGLRGADHIVVRGSRHKEVLAERGVASTWIPDGYEKELFYPEPKAKRKAGLTIGLLGSVIWNDTIQATYGWDMVETLAALPDPSIRGLLVGDGTGLQPLKDYAAQRGVADRIEFAGRVPYEALRPLVNRMDICLSTQTNDLPGQVRTTGKLPIYAACGRFILASRVGEAGRVLPPEMLVDYEGSRDLDYPAKLAQRINQLLSSKVDLAAMGAQVARDVAPLFEYQRLSLMLAALLERYR